MDAKKQKETEIEKRIAKDKKDFIRIFTNKLCDISKSCASLGISRQTFYNWCNTDLEFSNAIEEAKEARKDFYESQLEILARGIPKVDKQGKLIGWKVKPDPAAVIFGNKALNKDRGYIERQEHTIESKEPKIDLNRLTEAERDTWFRLLDKALLK